MKYIISILLLFSILILKISAQESVFVFYNVENLFDVKDDPETADDEFTPEGDKHWTYERYMEKLDHISHVLVGVGKWQLPGIVGLCEVENIYVLRDLASNRLLESCDYHIIHRDSPDERGIDVALLYREDIFKPVYTRWIRVTFKTDTSERTRDILYAKGLVFNTDTFHIFINHWPSRYGGVEYSMPRRFETAYQLWQVTDSILHHDRKANILIAGDFNDTPEDLSVLHVLKAQTITGGKARGEGLYNLMTSIHEEPARGTLKYKSDWEVYDQIIISKNLALGGDSVKINRDSVGVYDADFLLEKDDRYIGVKPFRTYAGPQYLGGYSDHLPVYLRLFKDGKKESDTITGRSQ